MSTHYCIECREFFEHDNAVSGIRVKCFNNEEHEIIRMQKCRICRNVDIGVGIDDPYVTVPVYCVDCLKISQHRRRRRTAVKNNV